ncbi:MAG: hypothetical protein IPF94_15265 [Betaproteobacteria bacterium]|nr:hypothetical protein [Betaproteobacteria bacterium]
MGDAPRPATPANFNAASASASLVPSRFVAVEPGAEVNSLALLATPYNLSDVIG